MGDGPLHDYYGAVMHPGGTRWHQWLVSCWYFCCLKLAVHMEVRLAGTLVPRKPEHHFTFIVKPSTLSPMDGSSGWSFHHLIQRWE